MNMKNISYSIVQNIKLDILSMDLDKFCSPRILKFINSNPLNYMNYTILFLMVFRNKKKKDDVTNSVLRKLPAPVSCIYLSPLRWFIPSLQFWPFQQIIMIYFFSKIKTVSDRSFSKQFKDFHFRTYYELESLEHKSTSKTIHN